MGRCVQEYRMMSCVLFHSGVFVETFCNSPVIPHLCMYNNSPVIPHLCMYNNSPVVPHLCMYKHFFCD